MRVKHRRLHVRVAEELLDGANVVTGCEKMRREGVAQGVRRRREHCDLLIRHTPLRRRRRLRSTKPGASSRREFTQASPDESSCERSSRRSRPTSCWAARFNRNRDERSLTVATIGKEGETFFLLILPAVGQIIDRVEIPTAVLIHRLTAIQNRKYNCYGQRPSSLNPWSFGPIVGTIHVVPFNSYAEPLGYELALEFPRHFISPVVGVPGISIKAY